ncbi:MAG: DUF3788 domain-containing protein [Bacteroides sp.]|nr:DUF3788 domain-containing protein [Bacteroides sp.]
MEAKMLLKDPDVFPSDKVLNSVLGDNLYSVLGSFLETITSEAYGLSIEWRFYNDGKTWLGKVTHKKKTIFWLSVWEGFFKVSFYFTEKHREGIAALDIPEAIRQEFALAKPTGKLIPLIIDVYNRNQLQDIQTIVRLKKSLK